MASTYPTTAAPKQGNPARIGCRESDLIPQTVAHAALGTSMAAFLVWVDDPSSDLVENLEQAHRLLGAGLAGISGG